MQTHGWVPDATLHEPPCMSHPAEKDAAPCGTGPKEPHGPSREEDPGAHLVLTIKWRGTKCSSDNDWLGCHHCSLTICLYLPTATTVAGMGWASDEPDHVPPPPPPPLL